MTLDNARMRLWATVAVTFAGSSLIILLRVYVRVYARGKSSHWVWCDWLNVLTYVFGVAFWILVSIGLSHGLGKESRSNGESDRRVAALTFFLSQALALVSVGTGRLASAVALSEAGRQSSWELASWIGSCLCGLWIVAETLLATVSCSYDETEGRFVCFGQVSRWVAITTGGVCLEVCLVLLWNMLFWRLKLGQRKRLKACATSSSRLLLLPLVGGRFVTYERDMGNDGGGSDDLRSTIVLNAILILAGIFTTNLPQLTNMPLMTKMRRSSMVQGPGTKDGQNEVSSAVERSVTSTDEVMMLGEEGLGLGKPLALTSPPGYGLPKRPPPMRASTLRPLPAPGSIVGEPSTRALLAPSQNSLIISYPSPPLPPPPPPPAQLPPQPLPLASSPGHGPPETPPPMRALPRAPLHPLPSLPPLPPIGMVVPVLMTCSRQPTLPSPQHQSRQQPLTSRSSRSTFKEPWDSRSAHSVLGTAVPPPQEWSSFN